MPTQQSACGSCGAPIYWLKNVKTGRPAPIDARHNQTGNVAMGTELGEYRVLLKVEADTWREQGWPLYTNHFMTCPQAKTWHKHGGKRGL